MSESSQTPIFSTPNILTGKLYETLKRHPKRIVFADGEDERVIRVASRMVEMEIGIPILLGNRDRIRQMAADLDASLLFVNVLQPDLSSELPLFIKRLKKSERYRGRNILNPEDVVTRPHNFAALMIQYGHADAMVAGNDSIPASVFRAAFSMIKPDAKVEKVFGANILVAQHLTNFGRDNILFLADCGVIPEPNIKDLATIATVTGQFAHHFLGRMPRVSLLSHSTKGISQTPSAKKVAAATELATQMVTDARLDIKIRGEIQADVALDPAAAEVKLEDSDINNPSDVLVFPNLDAGHMALKLLQHVAGAQNYGQFVLGLEKPVVQVPRTATEETLLGSAAIAGVQAIRFNDIYIESLKG